MQPGADPARALALRLRALREEHWPGRVITQAQLAEALGAGKPLSVPLISSWESTHNPKTPPLRRIEAYASFFATERSVAGETPRLFSPDELTPVERGDRARLLDELVALRNAASTGGHLTVAPSAADPTSGGMWRFPVNENITIVCARLPSEVRQNMPYADPADPDHVELYTYADLDALMELYGHVRAFNPNNQVRYRTSDSLVPDDYTAHLVLLGGVDWNAATRTVFRRVNLPAEQIARQTEADLGGFRVKKDDGQQLLFAPKVVMVGDRPELLEDVALYYRGINPYNKQRTLTICNGMYGRGTLGAVRALTDVRFRDRNEEYIAERFAHQDELSIITRVPIANGQVVTPDWTEPEARLHEWPEERG